MARGTTLRNVRVSDDLWTRAQQVAAERGEAVSDAVRRGLEQYAEGSDEFDLEDWLREDLKGIAERRGWTFAHVVEVALGAYSLRHGTHARRNDSKHSEQ